MKKYGDLICGTLCAVIAAAVLVMSIQIGQKESASIGADFVPKIASVIMLIFSVVLMVRGWKASQSYEEKKAEYPSNLPGILIMIAALVLYAATLKTVGFLLTTVIFLFLAIVLMSRKEETHYVLFIVISVAATLAIYLIFTRFFSIRLPRGLITFI